jgi:hypothetical protein
MTKGMLPKIAIVVFFVAVFGLLIARRFAVPPQERAVVIASQNSDLVPEELLQRGQTIETEDDEFVAIKIGSDLIFGIDERSRVELHRLFANERMLRFPRGRMIVMSSGTTPVYIETNKTVNVLENGKAIFINYDFEQMVTIAPVQGSVQTHIKGARDYLLIPVALNIKETNPVSFSKTNVDTTQGHSAAFHRWFDQMIIQ